MYFLEIKSTVDRKFAKLAKKNKKRFEIVMKKLEEILENPYRYKQLKAPLQNMRRVHIEKSFVLIFSIEEKRNAVIVHNLAHHDEVYHKGI